MRFLGTLLVIVAAITFTACSSKSSSSSSGDQSSAAASSEASPEASAAATTAAGDVPSYPGATTQAAGSSSTNMMGSAAGKVMSTTDSFDKVYSWYQKNMPAGSEKSHVTAPVESAVFMMGEPGSGQTSVTITTQGGKTMISIAKVKM
jgi:hypothetical protein